MKNAPFDPPFEKGGEIRKALPFSKGEPDGIFSQLLFKSEYSEIEHAEILSPEHVPRNAQPEPPTVQPLTARTLGR
jgi:hypothetical protein